VDHVLAAESHLHEWMEWDYRSVPTDVAVQLFLAIRYIAVNG